MARVRVAQLYADAIRGCRWLVPQQVPAGFRHVYWTYVLRLDNANAFSWEDFRGKYLENGGDPMYGAWRLTYLEPAFYQKNFFPEQPQTFQESLCPIAERIQPQLLQFKTNYFDFDLAKKQADALHQTIRFFDS